MEEEYIVKVNQARDKFKRLKDQVLNLCLKESYAPVKICAATKTVNPIIINSLVEIGLDRVGENKVQELNDKYDSYDKSLTVDFIGTLQSNKVRSLVGKVSLIQSLSTKSSLLEIQRVAEKRDLVCDCLLEINSAEEDNKSGLGFDEVNDFLSAADGMKNVRILGLMTVGANDSLAVNYFTKTKRLFDELKMHESGNIKMEILSMGMSENYADAIRCGSNMIRPGRAIFGERVYNLNK